MFVPDGGATGEILEGRGNGLNWDWDWNWNLNARKEWVGNTVLLLLSAM